MLKNVVGLLFLAVLLASSPAQDAARDRALAEGARKSPLVTPNLNLTTASFRSLDLGPTLFRFQDDPYVAVRFKAPADVKSRTMVWGFEPGTVSSWYIIGLDKPLSQGFKGFERETAGNRLVITQTLPGSLLEPNAEYGLWFQLTHPRSPKLSLSLNFYGPATLNRGAFGALPAIPGLSIVAPFEVIPNIPDKASQPKAPDTDLIGSIVSGLSGDRESESKRKRELGEGIPPDIHDLIMEKGKAFTISVNREAGKEKFTRLDLSDSTVRIQGKTYVGIQFSVAFGALDNLLGRSADPSPIRFAFHLPSCDAFGVVRPGLSGNYGPVYVPTPPAKPSGANLIVGSIPVSPDAWRTNGTEWVIWFRVNENVEPILHYSFNLTPELSKILPLLGKLPA